MKFKLQECDMSFLESSRFKFVNEIVIKAPPNVVFNVLWDLEHEKYWFPNYKHAKWLTDEPHGVGSRRLYQTTSLTLMEEFIIWQPGEALAFWFSEISLPLLKKAMEVYTLTQVDNNTTKLVWRFCYEPNPIIKIIRPLVHYIFKKDFAKASRNIKSYIESKNEW